MRKLKGCMTPRLNKNNMAPVSKSYHCFQQFCSQVASKKNGSGFSCLHGLGQDSQEREGEHHRWVISSR